MIKNKLAIGLSVAILSALWGGGFAHAKTTNTAKIAKASPHSPMSEGEPVKSHNDRQKTPHSDKKAAAARLKVEFKQTKANEIAGDIDEQGQKQQRGVK